LDQALPTIENPRNAERGPSDFDSSERHYGLFYLPGDQRCDGREQFQAENDHKTLLWIQDTSIPEVDDLLGLRKTQVRCTKVDITIFLPIELGREPL
jgi:hypothetical protein